MSEYDDRPIVGVCQLDDCDEPIRKPLRGKVSRWCSPSHKSKAAYRRAREARLTERACEVCGGPIDPARPIGTKYCSPECVGKARYQADVSTPERRERHNERARLSARRRGNGLPSSGEQETPERA